MFPYGKAGGEAPRRAKWGPSGRWPTQGGAMFRSGKVGAVAGARCGASRSDAAAGEEREVEEVRRQASEGKERSLSRSLVESLPRPGFHI